MKTRKQLRLKKPNVKLSGLIIATLFSAADTGATVINVENEIAKKIVSEFKNSFSQSTKSRLYRQLNPSNSGYWYHMFVNTFERGDWSQVLVKDIRLTAGNIEYSEVKTAPIPETISKEAYLIGNCTSLERTYSEKLTTSHEEGYSIVKNDTIKSETMGEAGLDLKFEVVSFSFGATITESVSFSSTETESNKRIVEKEISVSEKVPPFTALIIEIDKRTADAYLDFVGSVIPDANFGFKASPYHPAVYSSYVDSNSRSIQLRGEIWNSKFESMDKRYTEIRLPTNPTECLAALNSTSGDISTVSSQSVSLSQKISEQPAGAISLNKLPNEYDIGSQSFDDYVVLRTDKPKLVGSIQVRSRSTGGQTCGVTVESNFGDRIQYLAPREKWSDWQSLSYYSDSQEYLVAESDTCSGLTESQIRYE